MREIGDVLGDLESTRAVGLLRSARSGRDEDEKGDSINLRCTSDPSFAAKTSRRAFIAAVSASNRVCARSSLSLSPPPLVKMRLRWGWRCSTTLKVGKQAKRWDDSCGRDFPAKVKLRVQRGLLRADKGSIARAAELRNILLPGCKVERSSTGWMPAWMALLAVYRAPSCRRCLASSARSVLTLRARSLPGGNRVAVRLRGSSSYVSRSRASPPRSGSLAAEGTHLQSVTACRDHCGSQRTTP